ncbi:hypothetical protein Acid345_1762 [Candidatus Koribacter versatilis Ellin345]|uniref:Uncharacterized protein n=1 Tax=Koribacter versatilis (strain Ellin345) TaxID=204669 RepID=Q1IQT7_KORVE|nr:hypothetical protein [Candidatus Koribacter versatilis]ABF40763.1 hypothetical protein Acid345_1762 [Candidatus Koribacter versatilis Ellin345]
MRLVVMLAISTLTVCAAAQQSGSPVPAPEVPAPPVVERLMPESDCVKLAQGMQHSDSLLSFCDWVLTFRERLPNILADEKMDRQFFRPVGWNPSDTITMTAHYDGGRVEYAGLAVNGIPTTKTIFQLNGAWSTGELGASLEGLVADVRASRFKFDKEIVGEHGEKLLSYEFKVRRAENGSWALGAAGNRRFIPGYEGKIVIDEATGHCVEFERMTTDVDPKFPVKMVKMKVRYDDVRLADNTNFALPVSAESFSCMGKVMGEMYKNCAKVEVIFQHWRKFGAEHRILPEGNTLPPN